MSFDPLLQSDYHVCSVCGSFDQCEHDDRDEQPSRASNPTISKSSAEDDTCEMVTNSLIHADAEVFNTYDSSAPNSKLLVHYGFMLEANSNDMVFFEQADLSLWLEGLDQVPMEGLDDEEGLFQSLGEGDLFFEIEQDEGRGRSGDTRRSFAINAEGVLSMRLFSLLVLKNMWKARQSGGSKWPASDFFGEWRSEIAPRVDPFAQPPRPIVDWLKHSSRLLFTLFVSIVSVLNTTEDDEDDGPPPTPVDDSLFTQETYAAALGICSDTDHLCNQKLQQLGPDDTNWETDWGEILDVGVIVAFRALGHTKSSSFDMIQATPPTLVRTRMAITHAMNERNILVACRETWRDIGELVAARHSLMDAGQ